jgi:formamidopyrimidine-DNA glycosylase
VPELPEVHTITSDLKKTVLGFNIVSLNAQAGYKISGEPSLVKDSEIRDIRRVAKNILVETDEYTVLIHLAMTGRVLLLDKQEKGTNWVRAVFYLQKNAINKVMVFSDMRMFGKVAVLDKSEVEKLTQKYGPEPINTDLDTKTFLEVLKQKNTIIKNALLDQSIVAGLGNIYATEALFLSGIHPETPTKDIDYQSAEKLLTAARSVLNEGIEKRGSTLPDKMYVDIFGRPGKYQESFKIYMKSKCPTCFSEVQHIKIQGRGTYFCPECQQKKTGYNPSAQKELF